MSTATVVALYGIEPVSVLERSYGRFKLPYRKAGQRFGKLVVPDQDDVILTKIGDTHSQDKYRTDTVSGRAVAEDLINDETLSAVGYFVIDGNRDPTDEELASAESLERANLAKVIQACDTNWERKRDASGFGLGQYACRRMGVEREWAPKAEAMTECPGCGERVKMNVAICKHCGAILDRGKAEKLGMLPASIPATEEAAAR